MRRDSERLTIVPREPRFRAEIAIVWASILFVWGAVALCALLGVAMFMLAASKSARAHEWYDRACCSERDCYSISADEVEALTNGDWRVKATGDVFSGPHGKSMNHVRFSPDGQFHRCSWNGDRKMPSICLYVPLPDGS